ncbi:MAG: 7-carboxy-7-deazaguanine synthase QueE [Candidatus Gastranaerophilales bacterium]|nr:7-carboxy-7-deazaguanine synthase QueE [Candidatus Gastranaerophilales bacterium]
MQNQSTKIREIFTSIQGEGPYIGQKHIFVRFCKCNLNCDYCDTDFNSKNAQVYDIYKLFNELDKINCEVVSFTGGEPLMDVAFLKDFLKSFKVGLNKKIYLETNGILYEYLNEIIDYIDIISMDIKLQSATGQPNRFIHNKEFLRIATKKETFIKVVFDENIIQEEIDFCTNIAKKYGILLVLQPKMPINEKLNLEEIYNKFFEKYENIRLIPQVHKYLNLA